MEIGVSTASFFGRQYNEDALATLSAIDAKVCEIFLETFSEYTTDFAMLLKERAGNLKVHSIHTLNTHFEPQLFSKDLRAREDAEKIFRDVLASAKILGAKNYTMHGIACVKKNGAYEDYERYGKRFQSLTDISEEYGVELCIENVEWCFYRKPGFFSKVKCFAPKLKTCLDIKQARLSGYSYQEYLKEMKGSLNTVHLSDCDSNGKISLPLKGDFDFYELFTKLFEVGFDGNALIEVYNESYNKIDEIFESLEKLRNIKKRVYGR